MIPYVHDLGKRWGRYIRYAPGGWPTVSTLGRVMEYGAVGAAIRGFSDRVPIRDAPEDVIKFNRAWREIPNKYQQSAYIFYVWIGPVKLKARYLGLSVSSLYRRRDEAHIHIDHLLR